MRIAPYPLTTDEAVVRRVCLDAIGILPTAEEIDAFVGSRLPEKRALLIDALLERPEYTPQWLVKFEDWFVDDEVAGVAFVRQRRRPGIGPTGDVLCASQYLFEFRLHGPRLSCQTSGA